MARSRPAPGTVDAGTVYRRGFAPSPPPRRGHPDFDEDAAGIVSLIEHRPRFVAHSYGGVGAMLAAARAPQRVRSLTLIEPPVQASAMTGRPLTCMAALLAGGVLSNEIGPRHL
jgi:pimeloyl-ACP methyl ester carboxylesterase